MNEITANELESLLQTNEQCELIDVREQEELIFGKIPAAKHIPLEQLIHSIDTLDKNKQYILICHSGGRSGMACQYLAAHGYQTVNVVDGMVGWQGAVK